jgi:hypothetical protein
METTQAQIEQLKGDIEYVCNFGPLFLAGNLPLDIQHAYHRVILDIGGQVGWTDYKNFKIDSQKLIENLPKAINTYKHARELLSAKLNIDELNSLPDTLILESLFRNDVESKLVASVICSTLTIIQLISFHRYLGALIGLDYIEENNENLLAICNAQTQLLNTQSYINRSQLYLYESKSTVDKAITEDEIKLYIENEKNKQARTKGGSHSPYYQHEDLIKYSIQQYKGDRALTQSQCITQIEQAIKEKSGIEQSISTSTFNNWWRNYRDSGGSKIFQQNSNN